MESKERHETIGDADRIKGRGSVLEEGASEEVEREVAVLDQVGVRNAEEKAKVGRIARPLDPDYGVRFIKTARAHAERVEDAVNRSAAKSAFRVGRLVDQEDRDALALVHVEDVVAVCCNDGLPVAFATQLHEVLHREPLEVRMKVLLRLFVQK